MSPSSRIFHLIEITGVEQKVFAQEIGTTDKVVSTWKRNSKSYKKYLSEICGFFNVPPDYLLGTGVFQNWDTIMKYPVSVYSALKHEIPAEFIDTAVSREITLVAWLDKRMCYGIQGTDELALIRWFYRAISFVEVEVYDELLPDQFANVRVTVVLKPVYEKFLGIAKKPATVTGDGPDPELWELLKRIPAERMPEVERYLRFQAEQKEKP